LQGERIPEREREKMKLQINQEAKAYELAWSGGAGGKKVHLMQKPKAYADMPFEPACGSGVNSAGQSWKQASKHGLLLAEVVESDRVCSKCLKSEYVVEVAA
jgi:hypothetical protein